MLAGLGGIGTQCNALARQGMMRMDCKCAATIQCAGGSQQVIRMLAATWAHAVDLQC